MKVRESGMPDEGLWTSFFDPRRILAELDFPGNSGDAVDFGCGYGTFSVAAAAMTTGTVYAIDLEPEMTHRTALKGRSLGLPNLQVICRDFIVEGTGLAAGSVGYAMLFNILHAENPLGLLREAYRVLAGGGKVGMIHWIHDASTPRGPDLGIRPKPAQCQDWAREAGFELVRPLVALPPHHYGVVGRKP